MKTRGLKLLFKVSCSHEQRLSIEELNRNMKNWEERDGEQGCEISKIFTFHGGESIDSEPH